MSHHYNPSSITPMHIASHIPPQSQYNKSAATQQQQSTQRGAHEPIVDDLITDNSQAKQSTTSNKQSNIPYVKQYRKGKFLGKGGFAYVYEMMSIDSQRIYAGKVVAKSSITKPSSKTKLLNEIRIHRQLSQQYIVKFERFFEDKLNVYILLELCPHFTLMELIKRRKRLSECECIYFMSQLIQALQHLHSNYVIHRDLKLGNLFLSENHAGGLELKVGDFGLATKLEHAEERKKTLCGTPNYIAPEILDNGNSDGHSFEVDIWACGVIMYTLLVGSPPFETESVKTTYRKIRDNSYDFPAHVQISTAAKQLIQRILHSDPTQRPSLDSIATDPFFNQIHLNVPKNLPVTVLHTPYIDTSRSEQNENQQPSNRNITNNSKSINNENHTIKSNNNSPRKCVPFSDRQNTINTVPPPSSAIYNNTNIIHSTIQQSQPVLSRPVSASTRSSTVQPASLSRQPSIPSTAVIVPSVTLPVSIQSNEVVVESQNDDVDTEEQDDYKRLNADIEKSFCIPRDCTPTTTTSKQSSTPRTLQPASVWISQWVDYSNKYGMGYLLNTGHTGMYFNDATKIILNRNGSDIEYYERYSSNNTNNEQSSIQCTINSYPSQLHKKVTLVKHFNTYLLNQQSPLDRLSTQTESLSLTDTHTIYVKKWMKTKHATFFRLSNRTVQVQFEDNTEVIVDIQCNIVTYTDKQQIKSVHTIDSTSSKNRPDLVKRMQYTKSILDHLMNKQ